MSTRKVKFETQTLNGGLGAVLKLEATKRHYKKYNTTKLYNSEKDIELERCTIQKSLQASKLREFKTKTDQPSD